MANTYVNKVIIGSEVKLDLTQDDITADKLASGIKAHDKSGAPIVGTNTYDADTSDATAATAEILNSKTAYVNGSKITGTMPNNGAKTLNITDKSTPIAIPMGFHDGSGKAQISSDEQAGYNCLSSVTVAAIPVTYTDNDQGGQTLKVGV